MPHVPFLLQWILLKFKQRRARREGKYLTQADMNHAFVGKELNLSLRYPTVRASTATA